MTQIAQVALVLFQLSSSSSTQVEPIPMDIKPGLWEVRRAREIARKTEVVRECITKDNLIKPFQTSLDFRERRLLISSPTRQEGTAESRWTEGSVRGSFQVIALDQTHVKGALDSTGYYANRTFNRNYTFVAKWIRANCDAR